MPTPTTGTPLPSPEPAQPTDRLAATGVDLLLVLLVGSVTLTVGAGWDPTVRLAAVLLAIGLPTFVVEAAVGRSPGKLATQLAHAPPPRPGDPPPGPPLSLLQAAGRFVLKWVVPTVLLVLGLWLPAIVWWIALFLPALGPHHRAAHDRLTRSTVYGRGERQRAEGR